MFMAFIRLPTESVDNLVDSLFKRGPNARAIWPSVRLIIFYTAKKLV